MGNKSLVVANWKCNGGAELLRGYLKAFLEIDGADVVVCPPVVFLTQLQALVRKNVCLGAQDFSALQIGPYTGDISSEMILECGGTWTLIGHSERRALHRESEAEVRAFHRDNSDARGRWGGYRGAATGRSGSAAGAGRTAASHARLRSSDELPKGRRALP